MRVTTKGQVTIPVEVREKLGILPGTEVDFTVRGDVATIKKRKGSKSGRMTRGARLVALLAGSATDKRMTTDEIMALTRGDD